MRALKHLLAASALLLTVAGCAVEDSTTPSLPKGNNDLPTRPLPAGTYDPTACAAKTTDEIKTAFNTIVINNPISGWPSISAFEAKVNNVASLRGSDLDAARAETALLVDFLEKKYAQSPQYGELDKEKEVDALIADLWCFVGLGGTRFDINPDDTKKDFALSGKGGVTFPEGFCPVAPNEYWPNGCPGINVFLSEYTGTGSPLKTLLDTYGTYLVVESYPAIPPGLMIALPPTVAVCFNADPAFNSQMYLGHQKSGVNDPSGFSIRPRVPLGALETLLGCPDIAPAPSSPGVLGQLVERLEALLLPKSLSAAPMFAFGGVGGSAEEFSPFGAVDAGLMGGAGGSAEEFAPPVMLGPNATTYAADQIVGTAGTGDVVSGLPSVGVQTRGRRTPIDGATVSFVLQATKLSQWTPTLGNPAAYPAPSSLCAADYSPETAGGTAALPCISFGTKAGYMNVKATVGFDELDFPGSGNLEFCEESSPGVWDCDANGTIDKNWLVVTEAAAAALISKVAGDGQTASAYTNVAVAPKVLVTDIHGNPVGGATVTWSPNVGLVDPASTVTIAGTTAAGTTAVNSWTLGVGDNTLLAELMDGTSTVGSVQFSATGTYTLSLVNGCVTGGAKDDIAKYGFYFPNPRNKVIQAIGINLSSNGAPGASENYEISLTATRGTVSKTVKARLQSSSNSSKGVESLVTFDFKNDRFPAANNVDPVTVRMTVAQIVGGVPQAMPSNRVVNMNTGGCAPGSKSCKPVAVSAAGCSIMESQLSPLVLDYRKGLAARIFSVN